MKMRRALPFCLLFLISCSGARAPLPAPSPAGDSYGQAAARLYGDLAALLAENGQAAAADRLREKQHRAIAGETIQPDNPAPALRKGAHPALRRELLAAHAELLQRLTPEALKRQPEISAQAMSFYDCWLAEATERHMSDAAGCQEGYLSSLATLESFPASDPAAAQPVPLATLAAETAPADNSRADNPAPAQEEPEKSDTPAITVTYIVPFAWSSTTLNSDAREILEMAMTDMHNIDNFNLVLNGHTDLTGTAAANLALSMKRAESVSEYLVSSGVPQQKITTYAFGDTDPKQKTPHGERSAKNRRVEVVIE